MEDRDEAVLNEARAIFKRAARLQQEATTQREQAARLVEHVRQAQRDTAGEKTKVRSAENG